MLGFMGAGKTFWGQKLAQKLAWPFIDLDWYIEQQQQQSITQIFQQNGADFFRQLEHNALKELLQQKQIVVALGGGTPCFNNNMQLIKKAPESMSLYLKLAPSELFSRLQAASENRPLIAHKSADELIAFIETTLTDRSFFYKQADYTLEHQQQSLESLMQYIDME